MFSAALIVTVVAALDALATVPDQPLNVYPALAVAPTGATVPASKNAPLAGVTVPPAAGKAAIVNCYWVLKLAV
jgi:hypothetical protein